MDRSREWPAFANAHARGEVVLNLLVQQGQHMDEAQKQRLQDGMMNIVSDWRKRAQAAHTACQELLGETTRRRQAVRRLPG